MIIDKDYFIYEHSIIHHQHSIKIQSINMLSNIQSSTLYPVSIISSPWNRWIPHFYNWPFIIPLFKRISTEIREQYSGWLGYYVIDEPSSMSMELPSRQYPEVSQSPPTFKIPSNIHEDSRSFQKFPEVS